MVVELIFALVALALAVHLGHLLEAVKDGGSDAVVLSVDDFAHVRSGGAVQLTLDARDVELHGGAPTTRGQRKPGSRASPSRCWAHRENANERHDAFPLLERQFGVLDAAYLLLLRRQRGVSYSTHSDLEKKGATYSRAFEKHNQPLVLLLQSPRDKIVPAARSVRVQNGKDADDLPFARIEVVSSALALNSLRPKKGINAKLTSDPSAARRRSNS